MGTTKTQIQGGGGRLAYVLMIGGYPKLLTSWGTTSAVVTAYAATDWTTAVSGLEPPGEVRQSIEPFRPSMDSDGITFVVKPDADDTFAKDVWATDLSAGANARLTASVDSDDATWTVNSTGDFASSGEFYCGTECCSYSGKTATTFTGVGRGLYEPFGREALTYRFGRHHRINNIAGGQAGFPGVTDYPKVWIGRSVACYCHRVVDGVLDVLAQAELVFAGHIAAVTDSESGAQHITCEDMRDYVSNSILLGDQWSCSPPEGAYLPSTEQVTFIESGHVTSTSPPSQAFVPNSTTLTVGTGGWLSVGLNTVDQIMAGITDFLEDAKNTSSTLDGRWTLITTSGRRAKFTVQFTTSTTDEWHVWCEVHMTDGIAGMLGFDVENAKRSEDAPHPIVLKADAEGDDPIVGFSGQFATAYSMFNPPDGVTITISEVTGTFINQGTLVPQPWQNQYTTTSGTWGFIEIRNYLFLAKQETATTYTLRYDEGMLLALQRENAFSRPASDNYFGVGLYNDSYIRLDEPIPRFKQVIIAHEPKFDDWLKKTFYSTGTTDYNETSNSLDKYDRQLSIGIPYQLLGTTFETSCTELASMGDQGITILIDKPTKLVEFLLPELLLRNAHLIMKDAGLAWTIPGVTTAASALHGLTESSKADPNDVTQTSYDRANAPITHLKVRYDRDIQGNYYKTKQIINEQARTDHGRGEALTLEARNAFTFGRISALDAIEGLIDTLSRSIQKFWSKALPVVERTIAAGTPGTSEDWFINPGDTISLSDNFVRDPTTGERGISTYPGWCLSITKNWKLDVGGMTGSIEVALHGDDASRLGLYSPAMKVDETGPGGSDAGYDAAGPYLYVKANEFSTSAEADDITHFDANDTITIMEKSPPTIGSPVTWTRTISAKSEGSQQITLSSTLSSPAWDNSKEYYIFSQPYASAQSTQQIHAFIGDDADGKVVDTVRTFTWGQQPFGGVVTTAPDATERHEYPVDDGTWEDDGEPCTPIMHRNAVYTAINLTNRRTAPHAPQVLETAATTTSTSYVQALAPFAAYIGGGELTASLFRRFYIAPIMKQTTSGTGTVRVTSSANPPRAASGASNLTTVQFVGPISQTEWTNTSTSYTNVGRQQLVIVPHPLRPYTWITVEFKTSANTNTFYGFHEWWLSELGG